MIYIDLTDLVEFARFNDVVSGIQRVVYNLARELEDDSEVSFVVLPRSKEPWIRLSSMKLESSGSIKCLNRINENWRLSRIKWSRARARARKERGIHKAQSLINFLLSRFVRPLLPQKELDLEVMCASRIPDEAFKKGDVIVVPSIPQHCDYLRMRLEPLRDRVKIVFFYHDIIPLTGKQFTLAGETSNFRKYFDLMMDRADLLITSAKFNVNDFRKYAAISSPEKTVPPIESIGLPVEFPVHVTDENFFEVSSVIRRLSAYKFCLSVGSVGPRKNYFELLQAWKKFYESDAYNNEILVVAGAPWESAADIVELLRNKAFCGGSIIYTERPSDIELSYLYENCRFTICISLFEGWGLPVSESIGHFR